MPLASTSSSEGGPPKGGSPVRRRAVRALLWSDAGRVLLIRATTPDTRIDIWLPPGGGIETGETDHQALQREIWEETGQYLTTDAGPVWWREHTYAMDGRQVTQTDVFYFLRVPHFEPTMRHNPEQRETDDFQEFRWWTTREIRREGGIFVPSRIAHFLEPLAAGAVPAFPLDVGR